MLGALPRLMQAGFALLGAGLLADLGYHLRYGIGSHPVAIRCCGTAFWAHALTLAGMLLALAAVFQTAIRSTIGRSKPGKE
jgi:hypothetical protein